MDGSIPNNRFRVGAVLVSPEHNTLQAGERRQTVQPRAMAVLQYLALHHERVVSSDELLETVWHNRVVTLASVQKCINALRTAFGALVKDEDYIVHYAKRGYQLVQPVHAEPGDQRSVSGGGYGPAKSRLALIMSVVVLLMAASGLLHILHQPITDPSPAQLPEFDYPEAKPLTEQETREFASAPQPLTTRLAFVRNGSAVTGRETREQADELVIEATDGSEWRVSVASGNFIDLAWSPSGRNLAALERIDSELQAPSNAQIGLQMGYYSFHIFTLDFKSERVIEKNLLSRWQGTVRSLTWWDDNTLEFVAGQGDATQLERYRYRVPDQALTRLPRPDPGQRPLGSAIQAQQSAVLSQDNKGYALTWLDHRGEARHHWALAFKPRALAWLTDGSAVGVLGESYDRVLFYGPNGLLNTADVTLPEGGRLVDINFHDDLTMIGSVIFPAMEFYWQQTDGEPQLLLKSTGSASPVALNPTRVEVMIAQVVDGKSQILAVSPDGRRNLQGLNVQAPVHDMLWSADASQLYVYADGGVWVYDERAQRTRSVLSASGEIQLLAVDEHFVWLLKSEGGVKTIWRQPQMGVKLPPKQFSFGHVSAAIAHRDSVYFQYLGLNELWRLDRATGETQQLIEQLPQGARILAAKDDRLFLISGPPCNEEALHQLNLAALELKRPAIDLSTGYRTLGVHRNGALLREKCLIPESKVFIFEPKFAE